MTSLLTLPQCIWRDKISSFLVNVEALARLDSAVANRSVRATFLENFIGCKGFDEVIVNSEETVRWLMLRKIIASRVVFVCELQALDSPDMCQFLSNVKSVTFKGFLSLDRKVELGFLSLRELSLVSCQIKDISGISMCSHLEKLTLVNCPGVTDDDCTAAVSGCPQLKICHIKQCKQLRGGAVVALLHNCVQLIELDLCGSFALRDVFAECTLVENLQLFRCLDRSFRFSIAPSTLHALARALPNIHTLHLEFVRNSILDDDLDVLTRSCPRLTSIQFFHLEHITDAAMAHIGRNLAKLTHLFIDRCRLVRTPGVMEMAMYVKNLRILRFGGLNIENEAILAIGSHCRLLEHLNIGFCDVNDRGLMTLNTATLHTLIIEGLCVIGTFAAHFFSGDSALRELNCLSCNFLDDRFLDAFPSGKTSQITTFSAGSCRFSEPGWLILSTKFPHLESLTIRHVPTLIRHEVEPSFRAHCPKLKFVDISNPEYVRKY